MNQPPKQPTIVHPAGPPLKPGTIRSVAPDGKKILSTWRGKLLFHQHVRFNFWQALKILLGYEMDCHVTIITEHLSGKYAVSFQPVLSAITDQKEVKTIGKLRHLFRPRVSEAPAAAEQNPKPKETRNAKTQVG